MIHIFHRWTKWESIGSGRIYNQRIVFGVDIGDRREIGHFIRQRRECEVCGKVEVKDAETKP